MEEFEVIEHCSLESDLPRMPDGGHFASLNSFKTLSLFPMMLGARDLETHKDPQSQFGFPRIYDSTLLSCVNYDITSATSVRTSVYVDLHMYYVLAITPLCLHDAGASSYA